jgi:hypothetical protein
MHARWISYSSSPFALVVLLWIVNGFLMIALQGTCDPFRVTVKLHGRTGDCGVRRWNNTNPHTHTHQAFWCELLKYIYLIKLVFKCKLILELTQQEGLLHGGFVTEIKSISNTFIVPSLRSHLVFTVIAPIIMNLFDIHVAFLHINSFCYNSPSNKH